MIRISALAMFACLLAGCSTPADSGTPQKVAKAKRPPCEAATGSHLVDPSNCGNDPFVHHGVLVSGRGGTPDQAEANNPGHP